MSKKKLLLIGGGVVVVVGIVILNLTMSTKKGIEVHAETVSQRDVVEKVSASGRIQPQTKVNITSQVNGRIISLPIREGDTVKPGQVLVVLDTIQLRSDLDEARYAVNEISARLSGAKTSLGQAQEEYDRQKRLFDNKLTSEIEYNNANYSYMNARAGYEAMTAQARQSESRYEKQLDNFQKARIVAPMPGIVTLVDCEVGEIAAAQTAFTQGKTLVTISNLNVFEVEVEVDETEIAKISNGQQSKIQLDAFRDTSFVGEVVEIGNTAILKGLGSQDQSTNFKVKVIFKDADPRIRPGMSATVDITTNKRVKALTVPYSAIAVRSFDIDSLEKSRTQGETSSVGISQVQAAESSSDSARKGSGDHIRKDLKGIYMIKGGKARFVEVTTGIADQRNIEVLAGVAVGDSVVTGPYRVLRTIKENEPVQVMKEMGPRDSEKKP